MKLHGEFKYFVKVFNASSDRIIKPYIGYRKDVPFCVARGWDMFNSSLGRYISAFCAMIFDLSVEIL